MPVTLIRKTFSAFKYSGLALSLVWETSRAITITMAAVTILAGVLPAAIAFVSQFIVDSVVTGIQSEGELLAESRNDIVFYVVIEGLLVGALTLSNRISTYCKSILQLLLGNKVHTLILEKALTLELTQFEDSEYNDKLARARLGAPIKPLEVVVKTFDLTKGCIALSTVGLILYQFSPLAVALLVIAGIPLFINKVMFSTELYELKNRSSETRRIQNYIMTLLTREDSAKEVKLLHLGRQFISRYRALFSSLYKEERSLAQRSNYWAFFMELFTHAAFYAAYFWVAFSALAQTISIGQMTMYLAQFKIGQNFISAVLTALGGIYEDNLYLSNLSTYLSHRTTKNSGNIVEGENRSDGIRIQNLTYYYPGHDTPAVHNINLHIKPGTNLVIVGENGSGKSTLIKLLTKLYSPSEGKIYLDGTDLRQWDSDTVTNRFSVMFQDYNRYQLSAHENIGLGQIEESVDLDSIREAAKRGLSEEFIELLPHGYDTQLGNWFRNGQELSTGQWQRLALSRSFFRSTPDILVYDEPTAALDHLSEAEVFSNIQDAGDGKISIVISHRLSIARLADYIIVLEKGRIIEEGSHESLLRLNGKYTRLYESYSENIK